MPSIAGDFSHLLRAKSKKILYEKVQDQLAKLAGGRAHVTDYTKAGRTMIYNIHQFEWDMLSQKSL